LPKDSVPASRPDDSRIHQQAVSSSDLRKTNYSGEGEAQGEWYGNGAVALGSRGRS
jgi:hypothetical protein